MLRFAALLLHASVLLLFLAMPASAEEARNYALTFAELAPKLRYLNFVWAVTQGDLNGDGIPDVAMLLTGSKSDDGFREERLVVLAGRPGGAYRLLSVSGEFCHPGKFYNLEIKKNSLFVEAVEYADAARKSSRTLQFRYNANLNDFALIGQETVGEGYEDNSLERVSANYLTGESIHTTREKGRTKSAKRRIANTVHPGLNGTACDALID